MQPGISPSARIVRRIVGVAMALAVSLAFFMLPAVAQPAPADSGVEDINSFSSTVTVRQDGTIGVVEQIEYYFPDARHGIYRDLPESYKEDGGATHRIPIKVLGVTTPEGVPYRYEVTRNGVGLRIKIGDPDRTVTGTQTYVISYEATGALSYDQQYPEDGVAHDELYWNVTGNAWEVPIRRVSATVVLPDDVRPSDGPADIRTKCFTGPAGSTDSNCVAGVQGTSAQFAANEPLTVVVGWPAGHVAHLTIAPPSLWDRLASFSPLLLVPLVVLFLYRRWQRDGRDPKGRATMMVEYDAPKGLTPAEVGTLADDKAEMKDVSAIIIDLAVRGSLKIREVEKKGMLLKSTDYEFVLTREYKNDASLKPFETQLLDALFAGGGQGSVNSVSQIKEAQTFYLQLPLIKKKIYEQLVTDGYYAKNPDSVRGTYVALGVIMLAVPLFMGGPGVVITGTLFGSVVLAVMLSGVAMLCFAPFMIKKTEKGVAARDQAIGFREYLDKAEKYRLQWQEKENIFEKFLPYAMAFGVAAKWSKAFEGMQMAQPSWYEGSAFRGGVFNPVIFYGALNSMNGAMVTAMQTSPQRSSGGSGFGGGGFSGGGGGGGGGGSW